MKRMMSVARRWLGALLLPAVLATPVFAADKPAVGEIKTISVKESMSPANAAFQACATGTPAGQTVAVGVDKSISSTGMVKFDGLSEDGQTLIEAKGYGYKIDEKRGVWKDGYVSDKMQRKVLRQADRQAQAAKSVGRGLKWIVPNEGIRRAFQGLLGSRIPVQLPQSKSECPASGDKQDNGSGSSF